MKSIIGAAAATAFSFLLAGASLGIGFYQREVARAEEALAAFDLAAAKAIYARLERAVEGGGVLPRAAFETVRAEVQLRRSRVSYWQRDYAAILNETAAAEEQGKALSPALRFIRANARYRVAAGERDREKVIQGLGASIRDYAKIIEADPAFAAAAFNYESLLMLRDDLAGGGRPGQLGGQAGTHSPKEPMPGMHGDQGTEPKAKAGQKLKVIVPGEGDEDPRKQGQEPSRGSATKKRG